MAGGDYLFWLGASAEEAETGSRASTAPVARRGPTGFDPAHDTFSRFVSMAAERLGEKAVARLCCVSFPTVDRWARGVTAPHPLCRPSVYAALGKALS